MKKLYAAVMALFAVFAFGAVLAGSASAETTLGAEWLATGNKITEALASETTGSLLLEDTKVGAAVICKGALDGTVGPGAADSVTEVLNVAKNKVTELSGTVPLLGTGSKGPDCETEKDCAEGTAASPIEVWPVGLPWKTEVFTMEKGENLDLILGSGYELKCLILGIAAEDTCTATETNLPVNNGTEGNVETPSGSEALPLATCSVGGAESGLNETVGISRLKLTNKEALSINSL